MSVDITPEMLEAARKKRAKDEVIANTAPDEGFENICTSCE